MIFSFNIYNKEVVKINPCALNISISAIACALSEDKNDDEIALLSAFFTQLGDSLATIGAARICNSNENNIEEF
jgi:hypothetical protein